jgi:hypothetical protein
MIACCPPFACRGDDQPATATRKALFLLASIGVHFATSGVTAAISAANTTDVGVDLTA